MSIYDDERQGIKIIFEFTDILANKRVTMDDSLLDKAVSSIKAIDDEFHLIKDDLYFHLDIGVPSKWQ